MPELSSLEKQFLNGQLTRRQFLYRLSILGLTAAAIPGFPGSTAHAATPNRGGHFRIGQPGASTSESLDPATYGTGLINAFMIGAVGNCLTEINEKGEIIPELAESFEPNSKATKWTFRLRRGVTFHNGKTLTADDVIASINHHRGEKSKSAGKPLLKSVTDIRKIDNQTVVFELESGNADFPYVVSEYFFIIFPEKDGRPDWRSGIATGGYKLVEFEPGARYKAERYPGYFKKGRAHFDQVEFIPINDQMARTTALVSGEVDCIAGVDVNTLHLLKKKPGIHVNTVTGTQHYTFPMFTDTPPFDDINVRLALKYAVDREQLVKILLRGYGQAGNDSPITPANRYFNTQLKPRPYDPDKARFYLKKAGLDSLSVTLHAADAAFSKAVDSAVLFKETASKAGIRMKVVREPNDGYWSNVWMKKPFCACFWSGRPTEDLMFSTTYSADSPWNDTHWKNKRFNELLTTARTELNSDKRRDMYWEMQEIISRDGGTIIPVFAQYIFAARDKLAHGPLSGNRDLDGWKSPERWWFKS
ncbi:ABC transporter substrate-binding protein [Desulfospira joergensenii]|uniref:ABC transporter substrate-binding protein n=1 Tax=Desulfospira joergensenii TaxID=53329 RepID=UPI0003B5BF66|nr:ABC transporter substrate-binding protein [Desulfospira joergensenii]